MKYYLFFAFLINSAFAFNLEQELKVGSSLESFSKKIEFYSSQFLGKQYDGGPLGEGLQGKYDQDPLFDFNKFDCTTYVETVLSLSLSRTGEDFHFFMNEIRYKYGVTQYTERNHFISLDWIENNSQVLKDITSDIAYEETAQAETVINKRGWYQSKKDKDLRLLRNLPRDERDLRLTEFRAEGDRFEEKQVSTPYVPLSVFFINEEVNQEMLNRIPHGAIISIVRPNWNLRDVIGTNLNISHQGFAIWKEGQLFFRHASTKGSVREQSFVEYFRGYIESETVKGFNVLQAL